MGSKLPWRRPPRRPPPDPSEAGRAAADPPGAAGAAGAELARLQADLHEARAARAKVRSDLEELLKAHVHQSRLLDRNQRAGRRLEEDLTELRERARGLEAALAQAQAAAATRAERIQALEGEAARHVALQAAHAALTQEHGEVTTRLQAVTRSRDHVQQERDRLAAQAAALHATLASRDAEIAALQATRDGLNGHVARLLQEADDQAAAVAAARAELERFTGLQTEHARLQVEYDTVSARCEVALAQLAEAEQGVETARATIKAAERLSASMEWRAALDGVLDAASELVRFDRGTLALVDALQEELKIEAARNSPIAVSEMSRFRMGEGIAGWSLSKREPVLVRDSRSDPRFKVSHPSHQPSSFIAVPLLAGTDGLGVLTLTRPAADPFSDQDLKNLVRIGNEAAKALTNARLVSVLRRRQEDLNTLVAKTRELWAATDATQLLTAVLTSACELSSGTAALLALGTGKGHGLEVAASLHIPPAILEQRIAWGAPAALDVMRSGKPWVAPMQEMLPATVLPDVEAAGLRMLISLPCHSANTPAGGATANPLYPSVDLEPPDEVVGVLNIYRQTISPVSPEQLDQLKAFADQASAAIRTARRWERMKGQMHTTAAVNTRLLGRERYIQQLQFRIQQLEQELGRYKAA